MQEASRSSVWSWRRAQVLLPGARRPLWSVKTVGWGHSGGLEIPQMEVIQVSSHYGWTLVTDGRVDDQLVWWSWHSKLSAWSPVRVSRVTLSCLRWSGRTVTASVQLEVIWPDEISGQPCWMEMSPMVGWPGLTVGIWVENDRNYTTSLTCTNTPHSRGARKQAHLHTLTDP